MATTAPNPSSTPTGQLTIGSVVFDDDEHPEEIAIPLTQMFARFQYIGGGKVVHALGAQPDTITWTGQLTDARVKPRVQALMAMTAAGASQRLTFLGYAFDVLVTKFTPKLRHEYLCPYDISVEVISIASGLFPTQASTSVDQQITALSANAVAAAQSLAADTSDASAQALAAAIGPLPQIVSSAGPNSPGSANTTALLTQISSAMTQAQLYLTALDPTNASKFANATQLVNTLTLIQRNVQSGQSQRSMMLAGADYGSLAAMVYGDASLGVQLMHANNSSTMRESSSAIKTIFFPNFGS